MSLNSTISRYKVKVKRDGRRLSSIEAISRLTARYGVIHTFNADSDWHKVKGRQMAVDLLAADPPLVLTEMPTMRGEARRSEISEARRPPDRLESDRSDFGIYCFRSTMPKRRSRYIFICGTVEAP